MVAQINGFPSWHSVVRKSSVKTGENISSTENTFDDDCELFPSLTKSIVKASYADSYGKEKLLRSRTPMDEQELRELIAKLVVEQKELNEKISHALDNVVTKMHAERKLGNPWFHIAELRADLSKRDYYENDRDFLNRVRVAGMIESFQYFDDTSEDGPYMHIGLRQNDNPAELLNIRDYKIYSDLSKKRIIRHTPLVAEGIMDSKIEKSEHDTNQQNCINFIRASGLYIATQSDIKKRPDWWKTN